MQYGAIWTALPPNCYSLAPLLCCFDSKSSFRNLTHNILLLVFKKNCWNSGFPITNNFLSMNVLLILWRLLLENVEIFVQRKKYFIFVVFLVIMAIFDIISVHHLDEKLIKSLTRNFTYNVWPSSGCTETINLQKILLQVMKNW